MVKNIESSKDAETKEIDDSDTIDDLSEEDD